MALNQTYPGGQTGLAPNINLTGYNQAGTQQGQQPTISNILVATAAPTATQRALTSEAIRRHAETASRAGPGVFWQVSRPTRTLKLTGAIAYVGKNYPGREGYNRFVYWPDFRVAGTVNEIYSAFRQAGVQNVSISGRDIPLSEETILRASLDPLNPAQRTTIEQTSALATNTGGKPRARHTLAEYIMIGNALKAASKRSTTAVTGSTTGSAGTGAGRGGRSPQANQQRLIQDFSRVMDQAMSGVEVPKVFDVTRFDANKFTSARQVTPPKSGRATAIRPVISINGRQIAVPVIAQPAGAANFAAFVQTIIANSKYAGAAQAILQAFNQSLQQRSTAVGVQGQQGGFAPTQGGVMNLLGQASTGTVGGFQPQQTAVGGFQPQQTVGGFQPQQTVGGVQLPQTGYQLPQTSAGFQLPQTGGGFQLPQTGGGFQLPQTGGGFQLPQLGQPTNPNILTQLGAASGGASPQGSPGGLGSPSPVNGLGLPLGSQFPTVGGTNALGSPRLGIAGGLNLPSIANTQLPSVGGQGTAFNLPTVSTTGGAFPTVSLPTGLQGSPQGY
jgi:hypothetical protein